MIFTQSLRIRLAVKPCDLRKSFDTLSAVVRQELRQDPLSQQLFVFLNRRADRVKLLYWDGSGLWVLTKRLEKGQFCRPSALAGDGRSVILEPAELNMLLNGIDLKYSRKRAWYEVPKTAKISSI